MSDETTQRPVAIGKAREEFLAFVAGVRPELHRYCARLTGSVIEGEDIVQDALAKAFYAMSLDLEPPPLRPWLFRIAHNAAMDFLKSHGHKYTEARGDFDEVADASVDEARNPEIVRAALARFLSLPVTQRSAVILKDVLGHSLEETAETMGTTIMAVKAALVRGRKKLSEATAEPSVADREVREALGRYAMLFNQRDWDGVRALIGTECQLDLVSKARRRGEEVGMYFARYDKEDISLRVVRLEGELALAAFVPGAAKPAYFILLAWEAGQVKAIRDFRYVPYIATEAEYESV